ncbi:AAA family ATPase [Salinimonas lutimaris]|uniref:AAA family ATPase n=1 Tax=Salinimonas lutimaris TaxID=914153 RepID=UPI0010BFEBE7|nr:ATP-binding protein [Salinimonas lutimaris]
MLLRFGFENFRSFSEYQEILLTASKQLKQNTDTLLIDMGKGIDAALPVAAIYGPNNSGKTNVLKAIRFFYHCVLYADGGKRKPKVSTFKLIPEYLDKPSTFDIDIVVNNVHYNYGFKIKGRAFTEEWLYEYSYSKRRSRKTLFERSEKNQFYFGNDFKGKNKTISTSIKESDLFLSYAALRFEHEKSIELTEAIFESFKFRFGSDLSERKLAEAIEKNKNTKRITRFLEDLDLEIVDIEVSSVEQDPKSIELSKKLYEVLSENFDTDMEFPEESLVNKKIIIKKRNHENEIVDFAINDESLGTRALISILTEVFEVIDEGGIFVVDELESSLHPLITKRILDIFLDKNINKNGAQLLFSTHESTLLSHNEIRKDQVWFTDRNIYGETSLTSMLEYKVNSKVNIGKGYLEGRFGGVPVLDKFIDWGELDV